MICSLPQNIICGNRRPYIPQQSCQPHPCPVSSPPSMEAQSAPYRSIWVWWNHFSHDIVPHPCSAGVCTSLLGATSAMDNVLLQRLRPPTSASTTLRPLKSLSDVNVDLAVFQTLGVQGMVCFRDKPGGAGYSKPFGRCLTKREKT